MAPRLSKRQLRELEELEQLERSRQASTLPTEDDIESSDEEDVPPPAKSAGAFGALDLGDDNDDGDQPDEEDDAQAAPAKKKSNKKKKKKAKSAASPAPDSPAVFASADSPATPSAQAATPSKQSKGKKKKGGKAEPAAAPADDGMDEIDRALAELAVKGGGDPGAATPASSQPQRLDPKWTAIKEVFAFDPKFLDSDAELRRMFGSKIIGNAPQAPRSQHHARFANNPHHSTSIRRTPSYLATPEPGWPSPSGVLGLTRYDGPEAQGDDAGEWHTFVHPPSYKQAQLMFLEVLQQADGNRLYDVLAALPYHVDTHMQLSEMMAQQGDQGASATHLARALYVLSAPLPPTFPSGSFRLAYSQIENRALFLGIARKVSLLVKRGTWRTAFEWAKIGLGMGGGEDPVGMLIDLLAPKAGQHDWFFKFLPALEAAYPDMHIGSYPGLAFAKAMCVRNQEQERKEGDEKSTAALKSAVLRFPMVATLLSNALGFDLPPSVVTHRRAQLDGAFTKNPSYALSLLSELYVARTSALWKDPSSTAWLRKAITQAAASLDDASLEDVRIGDELFSKGAFPQGYAPAGLIRAAFISDIASVRPYLPPAARSGTSYSFDPLPPTSPHATFYNDAYFAPLYAAGSYKRRGRGPLPGRPGAGAGGGTAQDVAAALRDGLARMLGMGPEGPQVELNDELRAELLEELAMLNGGGERMPGGFGGDEGEGEDDEEGEWEDEEGAEENTRNVLQRLANLFGVGGQAGDAAQAGRDDTEHREEDR
ncbi:hypothetical protein Rhopal_002801-T1 [Rhodotorula paludigena]|uniref:DUF654-domain-containing protein n=1 Tax=Rhodotorula paludigena TaxID=86838 RepID=A0AAV5GL93_9BASI|nr:hypothetical protein Rhopal_002801-T1 [Rhodotorula paludigena]